MNQKLLNPFLALLLSFLLVTSTGCAVEALEGLEAETYSTLTTEIGATEEFDGMFKMEAATNTIRVIDKDRFLLALERVKMEAPAYYGESPKLYIERTNGRDYFGEATDNQTIKITENNANAEIDLSKYNMSMYRVNGENVNIRETPAFNNYNLYKLKQLHKDDVVLVLRKVDEDWYEIRINKDTTGFVYAALLSALLPHQSKTYSLPLQHNIPITNTNNNSFYIISPPERAQIDYPRNTTVVWTEVPGATTYILRVELSGPPYDYTATDFYPMPYSNQGIYTTTATSITFPGMGEQVHRFKVTAKQGDLTIAETPWRYVNYTQ